MVFTNDIEAQVFFMAKDFSLQEVNIICPGMPMYFNIPFNYTIDEEGTKSIIKTSCNKGMSVMLTELADSTQLPLSVILY
jgi:hypothetical protein